MHACLSLGNLAIYTITVSGQDFGIGNFLAALMTFITVAFVIFTLTKITKRWGIE